MNVFLISIHQNVNTTLKYTFKYQMFDFECSKVWIPWSRVLATPLIHGMGISSVFFGVNIYIIKHLISWFLNLILYIFIFFNDHDLIGPCTRIAKNSVNFKMNHQACGLLVFKCLSKIQYKSNERWLLKLWFDHLKLL